MCYPILKSGEVSIITERQQRQDLPKKNSKRSVACYSCLDFENAHTYAYPAATVRGVQLNAALYDLLKKGVAFLWRNSVSIAMPRRPCASLQRVGTRVRHLFGDEFEPSQNKTGVEEQPFELVGATSPPLLKFLKIRFPGRAIHYLLSC